MNERRYSIREIQKMTQLSPKVLQDLIRKYRSQLNITTEKGPEGKELFVDHASLERLIFLKQLSLRQNLTQEEISHQLISGNLHPQEMTRSPIPVEILKTSLDELSTEVSSLGDSLQKILSRYNTLVKEVDIYRTENRELRKELENLRTRQNLIFDQMKRETLVEGDEEEQEKKGLLN